MSNTHDICADNLFHLERFKNELPHPSYICGFLDGDGGVHIRKLEHGYQTGISISQSRTNILRIMAYHFNGNIYANKRDRNEKRQEYLYRISPPDIERLINHIKNKCVIKHRQLELLCEFIKYRYDTTKYDVKEELYKECYILNNGDPTRTYKLENITKEYIAGIFDAEGCIYICKHKFSRYYVSITQKSHPEILTEIQKIIGFGKFTDENTKLRIYNKKEILDFFMMVEKYCIVKYNQIQYMKEFLETTDIETKNKLFGLMNSEKHSNEEIELDNIDYTSYIMYKQEKDKIDAEIKEKEREERLKQQYINKSIKMKTEQNHIYSAPKSEITKKRMSVAMSLKKRTITDEQILQVRALLDSHKNIEIEKITGICNNHISKIRNGGICLTTELEQAEKPIKRTKEEVAIMKRKISLEEIIQVFKYLIEGKNYNEIILHVENTTVDICKNIKAKMRKGILPFYKCEMREEEYEMYEKMLKGWEQVE